MKALSLLMPLLMSTPMALAAPSVRVDDHGDAVAVVVTDASLASERLRNYGDRIDVSLAGAPEGVELNFDDRTVKGVDVRGKRPKLSVQLRHGRSSTAAIADAAALRPTADGFALILPRDPEQPNAVAAVAAQLSEPRMPEAPIAPTAPVAPIATNDEAVVEVTAEASDTAAVTAAAVESVDSAAPAAPAAPATKGVSAAAALSTELDQQSAGGFGMSLVLTVLLLGASAGLVVYAKKKKPLAERPGALEIVASRSVGPKARLVLINAGERELLLSVSDRGARLLSEWDVGGTGVRDFGGEEDELAVAPHGFAPRLRAMTNRATTAAIEPDAPASEPEAPAPTAVDKPAFASASRIRERLAMFAAPRAAGTGQATIADDAAPEARARAPRANTVAPRPSAAAPRAMTANHPALAGLMKLRAETAEVNPEVATDDAGADSEWARELRMATRSESNRQ